MGHNCWCLAVARRPREILATRILVVHSLQEKRLPKYPIAANGRGEIPATKYFQKTADTHAEYAYATCVVIDLGVSFKSIPVPPRYPGKTSIDKGPTFSLTHPLR